MGTINRSRAVAASLAAFMLAAGHPAPASAQQGKPDGAAQQRASSPQAQPQPAPQGPALPDAFKLNMMIRSAIIALNQANQTGNYTVLQDLAAPSFRAANDSARLARIFAQLRARQLDLSPILFFTPKLVQQPQIAPNGILRLVGFFPTAPERVNFDLYFQMVEGQWRIFGIGVTTSQADVTAAVPPQAAPQGPTQGQPQAQTQKAAPPANASAQQPANSSSAAAPPPARRPARSAQQTPTSGAVENRTTDNATRIDLGDPRPGAFQAREEPAIGEGGEQEEGSAREERGFWGSFNPFSGD